MPAALTANTITVILAVIFAAVAVIDLPLFQDITRKDDLETAGLVEHLTVAALIPGILAAIFALVRYRRRFPSAASWGWLLLWTLACIYFAGEECSWGQWYLGYETPEALAEVNDQNEANLHNISSWLDQKPRAAVETFIILAGLILPVVLWKLGKSPARDSLTATVLAPAMCWGAAAWFLVVRFIDQIDTPITIEYGTSEFREFVIAWFLMLYLMSFPIRLARRPAATPPVP